MGDTPARVESNTELFIYNAPVVGARLRNVRDFYDHLAPIEDDSTGVAVGKHILRYGTVAAAGGAAAGVAAIVCL